ncbi:MAG: hypothetical protein J5727_02610 [Kiritimatiellae bacterium]|nr:hypothetical protein [Kiritimatiellia bacterium]
MRKLIAAAIAAVSLSTFAAWERVGSLQVADVSAQGAAIAKLGTFMGNPLAAAGMAAAVADAPTLKFFGPARDKTPMAFVVFLDGEVLAKDAESAFDSLEFAVLYPISVSKEELLKRHKGSSETNDVIAVKGGLFGDDDSDATTYVVFSEDGKWVGASDKVEQAKLALAEIPATAKSMNGDVVRLRVDEKAFKAIVAIAKAEKDADPDLVATLGCFQSLLLGVRVSDLGIDVRGAVKFEKDSECDKCGLKPLGQSPLAFAGKDAVYACAQAEGAGSAGQLTEADWTKAVELLKKHGLDVAKYATLAKGEKGFKLTLDIPALCKVKDDKGAFEKFDMEKFLGEAKDLKAKRGFSSKSPAYALAGVLKGFEPQWPVAERFAATLPEAASKKPYTVSFFSASSTLKAVASEAARQIPEEQRQMMKPVLDQLATETKTGCASMMWRQDDAHRIFFRISADECKCFGGLFTAAMMFGMEGDSFSVDADDDDDEDDDDN